MFDANQRIHTNIPRGKYNAVQIKVVYMADTEGLLPTMDVVEQMFKNSQLTLIANPDDKAYDLVMQPSQHRMQLISTTLRSWMQGIGTIRDDFPLHLMAAPKAFACALRVEIETFGKEDVPRFLWIKGIWPYALETTPSNIVGDGHMERIPIGYHAKFHFTDIEPIYNTAMQALDRLDTDLRNSYSLQEDKDDS